jgi:pectinesterase
MNRYIKTFYLYSILILLACISLIAANTESNALKDFACYPRDKAVNVNPDTHLKLIFQNKPELGNSGQIRIYDASDDRLVDVLDLSIPAGPIAPTPSPGATYTPVPYEYVTGRFTNANTRAGTPSGEALPTPNEYQLTIIGGFTDAFHFYPVIIHDNTATIYPHNNLLEYGRTYYVQVDPGVFKSQDGEFDEINSKTGWRFTTKQAPPAAESDFLVVSADGTGDFNTVQGAMDFIPDFHPKRITVFVRKGMYEEIVYFRRKANVTILGEDREQVVIFYENNEVFNPHPLNIKTNEVPGTFPSRRAAFAADNCSDIHLVNLTVKNTSYGQAEGLLLNGEKFIASHITIVGSGDALQSNGSACFTDCRIVGDGDTILGRGPAYFNRCELESYGPYMWIRNTDANHGNVFVNCLFRTRGDGDTVLARSPTNGGKNYTYSEAVLIDCLLSGISPVGWGDIGGDVSNIRYWEFNSRNMSNGTPVDTGRRHPASRRLNEEKDAALIADYRNPVYVLGGWIPEMAPRILAQPESVTAETGQQAIFNVDVAAVPEPDYQWFKNGEPVVGATSSTLVLKNAGVSDGGVYSVRVKNASGSVSSEKAVLSVR